MKRPDEKSRLPAWIPGGGLKYVAPGAPGFGRRKKGKQWIYLDLHKKQIRSAKVLKRIKTLSIPPAWTSVWICPTANGHIQATGLDKKGRKQYRYHEDWQKMRSETKFQRMYPFGKKLGALRRQIKKDINRQILDKQKVSALALRIMLQTWLRIGNEAYEKENGSYGLTTLKNRHLSFAPGLVVFRFKAKKGVPAQATIKGKALIRLLRKVKELPGQELFQYYDEAGKLHALNSADINNYLAEHMGADFTCKDFRTWAGSFSALAYIQKTQRGQAPTDVPALIDYVATCLGNTPTVCRKYYIHPALLTAYERGKFNNLDLKTGRDTALEKALLSFLKMHTV